MLREIAFYLVILVCNIIHGITGFAGTILAMPPGLMLVGYDVAKPILNVLAILSGFYVLFGNIRNVDWKELARVVIIMTLGILGAVYIRHFFIGRESLLYHLLGIFVILLALSGFWGLRKQKEDNAGASEDGQRTGLQNYAVLVLAGLIHGLFVSGGPLLVGYLTRQIKSTDRFRATISTIWVFLNTLILVSDIRSGLWTPSTIKVGILSVPFLLAGMYIGSRLYKIMSRMFFMRLTYILLLISGMSLLVK